MGKMGTTAEVDEVAIAVEGDGVVGDPAKDLVLVLVVLAVLVEDLRASALLTSTIEKAVLPSMIFCISASIFSRSSGPKARPTSKS
jgi:hypothetical protein